MTRVRTDRDRARDTADHRLRRRVIDEAKSCFANGATVKARWFLFDHTIVPRGTEKPRPTYAVHLIDPGVVERPACGYHGSATVVPNAPEPAGFVLACTRCLALSEVR